MMFAVDGSLHVTARRAATPARIAIERASGPVTETD